jgi:hypothetical protein
MTEKERTETIEDVRRLALDMIGQAIGQPVTIITEDRLRGAVVEALKQLEDGLVGEAYRVLLEASKL